MTKICKICENYRYVIYGDKPINCYKCNSNGKYKLKEIWICLGCGQPDPCKSDCPAGRGKAMLRQD